jgi:hypothetical protein
VEIRVKPDSPRAILPGLRIIPQHGFEALGVRLVESLVQITIHQLDQFAFRRLF